MQVAHDRNVGSIVIGHSRHGRMHELFRGSIVQKLLRLAERYTPERLAMPDIASPYHPPLLQAAVPGVDQIRDVIIDLVTF